MPGQLQKCWQWNEAEMCGHLWHEKEKDTINLHIIKSVCVSKGEMVRQARVLAQATSDLVNAMRSDAEAEVDVDNSKKLLAAAKLLADATARMVEAAKVGRYILSSHRMHNYQTFNQLSYLSFDSTLLEEV